MKHYLRLTLMLLVLYCTVGFAQSVTPIAEDGKTWWYSLKCYLEAPPSLETEQIHFGFTIDSTTEIDGDRWYNVFYVDGDGNRLLNFPVAYMCEKEAGCYVLPGIDTQEKLDALLAVPGRYKSIGRVSLLPYPEMQWSESMEEMKKYDRTEWPVLLYPRTLEVGDELTYEWMYIPYDPEEEREEMGYQITGVKRYSESMLKYIGEWPWSGAPSALVERVGITDTYGFGLFLFPFIWHDIPTCIPVRPSHYPVLERVCDALGNVIYRVGGDEQEYPLVVTESKVWNYTEIENNASTILSTIDRDGFHFQGTEVLDGITYNVFRSGSGYPVGYLRQEGPRVYVYDMDHDFQNITSTIQPSNEYLLYDFSLTEGDSFSTVAFDEVGGYKGFLVAAQVVDVYEETVSDRTYRCMDYFIYDGYSSPDYVGDTTCRNTLVEGIGPLRGLLSNPQVGWWTTGTRQCINYLRSVTTTDGEVLWADPSGVETVGADAVPSGDGAIYDLHGRRLAKPLPGSVYVRDGRKYVAR